MDIWLLLIPIISAIIGWLSLLLSGKLLLRRIIAKKASIANEIARSISETFSFTEIENKITDPANIKKVMPVIEAHVDDFLRNKLKEKMPVVSMFIGNKTIDSLKEVFLKEIEDLFPHVMKQFSGNLQAEIDIKSIVAGKITTVSAKKLESSLAPVLRYYQLCGAFTGFVIGVINVLIFLALN